MFAAAAERTVDPMDAFDEVTRASIVAARESLKSDADMTVNLANKAIGDEIVGELAPLIAKCHKLTKVDFHNCNITDQGAMYLTNALLRNDSVAVVDLSENHITAGAARHLAELATHSESFNRLKLAQVELPLDELAGRGGGRRGIEMSFCGLPMHPLDYVMIGETMKANVRTRSLELRGLPMTDLDMSWITGMLRNNTGLRSFTLSARELGEPGVRTLFQAATTSRLELVDVQAAKIPASAASALCAMVSGSSTLKRLHLYWNSLGDAGMNALCATLMRTPQPKLETLVVYNNELTHTGAFAVAEMLKRNTNLKALALVSNELGEDGCAALSEAVAQNTTLTSLDVSKAHLGWNIVDLARVFRENRTLVTINICGNLMNAQESLELAMAVRGNRVLRTLVLSVSPLPVQELLGTARPPRLDLSFDGMEISTVDIHFIAKCLRINTVLQRLNLANNAVRNEATHVLARNLHHNTTLRHLKMDEFWIPIQDIRGRNPGASTDLSYPAKGLEMRDFIVIGELLRKNATMKTLDLRGNDMHRLEEIKCLHDALQGNRSLTTLNFVWNTFGPDGMEVLADAIADHPHLTSLTLRAVGVGGGKGAEALARIVSSTTSITFLECVLNSLGAAGATTLSKALQENNSITELDLHNNLMGDIGATQLSECLERRSPLTKLNLRENKIEGDGVLAISDAMCSGTCPLKDLNLSYNEIGVGGAHSLAEMLRLNSCLQTLNMNSTRVHSDGAAAVGAMLRVNRTLSYLRISCKTVGTPGALAIADALKYNRVVATMQLGTCKLPAQALLGSTSQTRIDLSNSHLTDLDCAFVAECLRSNRVCTYLDVSGNNIKNHAVDVLNHALQFNVVLRTLKLDELELAVQDLFGSTGANAISFAGQFLSERDSVFIAATLKVNTPMSTLDLTNCNIGPAACQHLGEAFTKNGAITKLKLGHNSFGVVGAIALAPVLKADNVLQVLDLAGCEVGMDGATALADAVADNYVIEFIRFDVFPLPVQDLRGDADVTSIDYSYHDLCWHDIIFMCLVLEKNKFVEELDLSGNNMHNTSARCVAKLCAVNRFIRSIRLLDNEFNSVVGHIFADQLSGNRVVVNLELDDDAMVKRTRKVLRLLIKLNRRFVGEFQDGQLVTGEHRFMNGDVLRFSGDESLKGYEAHGVYCVAECPWFEVLLVVFSLLANYAELATSIVAILFLLTADPSEVGSDASVWAGLVITIMIIVSLATAKWVWNSGRRAEAWLQLVSLLTLKDAIAALHSKTIPNVTLDIRSEVPMFTFLAVSQLRAFEGVWRAGPNAFIFAGIGVANGWTWPVLAAAACCVVSVYAAKIVSDFHWVRVRNWNKKVEALEEFDEQLEDALLEQRKTLRARSMSEGGEGGAGAGSRGGSDEDEIPDLHDQSRFRLEKSAPRTIPHPWHLKFSLPVLLFRLLEIIARVAAICYFAAVFGPLVAIVLVVSMIFMVVYWAFEGDKVMDDVKATVATTVRVIYSTVVFPGFGDEAPSWVVGTQRTNPLYFFVIRGLEDVILAAILLGEGMGVVEDGPHDVPDYGVLLTALFLFAKVVVSVFYFVVLYGVAKDRDEVEYDEGDILARRHEIERSLTELADGRGKRSSAATATTRGGTPGAPDGTDGTETREFAGLKDLEKGEPAQPKMTAKQAALPRKASRRVTPVYEGQKMAFAEDTAPGSDAKAGPAGPYSPHPKAAAQPRPTHLSAKPSQADMPGAMSKQAQGTVSSFHIFPQVRSESEVTGEGEGAGAGAGAGAGGGGRSPALGGFHIHEEEMVVTDDFGDSEDEDAVGTDLPAKVAPSTPEPGVGDGASATPNPLA